MNILKTALLIAITFVMTSCNDKDPKVESGQRTVLVYMVGDNNLANDGVRNIETMQRSFDPNLGARLLVFYNQKGGKCSLVEIAAGQTKVAEVKVLKTYAADTDPCAASTLQMVVGDTRALAEAKGYSIMFWSHGTGWLPKGMHPAKVASVDGYSFGSTNHFTTEMEIRDMAAALPSDMMFDVIAFDACYMAGVEVAYELRDKTRYFVGSAAEILAAGFPYEKAMHSMLTADAVGLARSFYEHYNAKTGVMQSATIAAIKCSELQGVAREVASLVAIGGRLTADQQFGRYLGSASAYNNLLWDLGDMVHRTWGSTPAFDEAMARAVVYAAATKMLFENDGNGEIEVDTHCGLTAYIPKLSQPKTLAIYSTYAWARDTNLATLAK